MEIKGSSGLSKDDVDRMRKDAEANSADEKRKIELIDARNEADNTTHRVEKLIKEQGSKFGDASQSALKAAIDKVRDASKGEDAAAIKRASGELQEAFNAALQHANVSGGAETGQGPVTDPNQSSKGNGGDDVIDAEFEVKK